MLEDGAGEGVGVVGDGLRHARFGGGERGEPLAVDVDAVADGVVFGEGQGEAITQHLYIQIQHTKNVLSAIYRVPTHFEVQNSISRSLNIIIKFPGISRFPGGVGTLYRSL